MTILGIDPGIATIGFGVVNAVGGEYRAVEYGAIVTQPRQLLEARLLEIYDETRALIERHRPDCVSIEELFFNNNAKTAVDVCQGRGVILLAAHQAGLEIYEYTPLQVKSAVVGYGRAEKKQVMYMTRLLLKLKETPKPDDAADALALAICHGNHALHRFGTAR